MSLSFTKKSYCYYVAGLPCLIFLLPPNILMATSLFVAESLPIIRPDRVFIYSGRDNIKWYLWFIVSGTESKMQGEGSLDLLGAALKLSMFGKAN